MSLHSPARVFAPTLMLIVAVAALALASPPLALAQAAGDGDGGSGCVLGPLCGLGDASTWLQQTVEHILANLLSGLVDTFGGAIVTFTDSVNFLTHTPDNLSYNNDLVKQFATATQVLADGLLSVVVLVGGYNIMLRPYFGSTYAGARELLPRLLLGGILINTAAWRSGSSLPRCSRRVPRGGSRADLEHRPGSR